MWRLQAPVSANIDLDPSDTESVRRREMDITCVKSSDTESLPGDRIQHEVPDCHVKHETMIGIAAEAASSSPEHAAEGPENKNAWRFGGKWAPHEGNGFCRGLGKICCMGTGGRQAMAGPSGWCDLCNLNDLEDLILHGQGRLTHLLCQLQPAALLTAYRRIKRKLGAEVLADCKARVKRALQRKRSDRPRRGPRGPYKRKP